MAPISIMDLEEVQVKVAIIKVRTIIKITITIKVMDRIRVAIINITIKVTMGTNSSNSSSKINRKIVAISKCISNPYLNHSIFHRNSSNFQHKTILISLVIPILI
jgi:hypothetical protein